MSKSLFKSKTFWIAVAQALVGIDVAFATQYPTVGWLLMAKSVLDVVIRVLTVDPVTL